MASLKIPANVPLPEEDSEQLHKAFKGFLLISLILLHCSIDLLEVKTRLHFHALIESFAF